MMHKMHDCFLAEHLDIVFLLFFFHSGDLIMLSSFCYVSAS